MADDDNGDPNLTAETSEEYQLATGQPAFETDRVFFRMVAVALGLAIVFSVTGSIWLALFGKEVPESLVAIGSASVGALAGVLTGRRQSS